MTSDRLNHSHGYLEGVGGLRLHYQAWEVDDPRAAITIIHGFGEHSGRYQGFADTLAEFGFSSYALDLRGHGVSEGRRGYASRFEILLQDVDRFRREVAGLLDPAVPVFLLGHSMGGLVATRYLEEFEAPLQGAIITSPWFGLADPPPEWKLRMVAVLDRILPALPVPAGLDADHLSHDPAVVEAYREDPLVHGTITPRLLSEIRRAIRAATERRPAFHTPALFVVAGDDRIVDTDATVEFVRGLPGEVEIDVVEGYYHEVLNEVDRAPVFAGIRDWISRHLRPSD